MEPIVAMKTKACLLLACNYRISILLYALSFHCDTLLAIMKYDLIFVICYYKIQSLLFTLSTNNHKYNLSTLLAILAVIQ